MASKQRGSALIETAFVLPVFALLVLTSVDLARFFQGNEVAVAAARAGVHRALQTGGDLAAAESAARTDAGGRALVVKASRSCGCSASVMEPGDCEAVKCPASRSTYVRVETRVDLAPFLKLPGMSPLLAARGDAWLRLE